jgi:hypothetical protein
MLRLIDFFSYTSVGSDKVLHRRHGTTEDPLDFLQLLLGLCVRAPLQHLRAAVKKEPDPHLLEKEIPKLSTIPPHLARLSTVLITTS